MIFEAYASKFVNKLCNMEIKMKKLSLFTIVLMGLLVISCSSASKKEGPLDAQWQTKNKSVAYKNFTAVAKWAAGQYTVTGKYVKGKRDSIERTTIVGKDKGDWVFESIVTNNKGKVTGMQMCIKGYDKAMTKGDASEISLVWIKMLQEDGTVQLMEGDSLIMYNTIMKSTWNNLVITANKYEKGEAVSVPAGNFSASSKITTTVKILFQTITATTYLHPDVPVNGVIKTVSDKGEVMSELLDYGFNGKAIIE